MTRKILTAVRTTLAALLVGLGGALGIVLVVLACCAAVFAALVVLVVAILPVLLIAFGIKLWPGGGLRMTDPEGTAVTLFEAIAHGIKTQREKRRAGADPRFMRQAQ